LSADVDSDRERLVLKVDFLEVVFINFGLGVKRISGVGI